MSKQNEITDEEFVPFLHSLGVETYKKSFEWMLSDPTFAGVFSWLYNNFDQNNALTAREEYRYAELKKLDKLLSQEELDTTLSTIQQDFPGICLPGDQECLEDVKLDISMQKERLHFLEKEDKTINNLIKQNEASKEQLTIEITKLNAAQQQYADDESAAASECLTLAEEVENLTEGVIDVIADALDMYANCYVDKDISKKFLSFGPLEPYRQSQALFRSHFNLYSARKFNKRQNDSFSDEDLRSALLEARSLEDRLSDAAMAYIDSKADLCGEQAKLEFVSSYNNVHPSQIATFSLEAQSALELLVQEEAMLYQQVHSAVKQLVTSRTQLAIDTATAAARAKREQILADLTHLASISAQALSCDRALYWLLRHELRALEESAQFAAQLRAHARGERAAIQTRIESMKDITSSQEQASHNLKNTPLLSFLFSILGWQGDDDVTILSKLYGDCSDLKELREDVKQRYRGREEELRQFKASIQPMKDYIYDGCTRQPNCYDRTVTSLTHTLKQELDRVEKTVLELGGQFTSVKGGDKDNMRKLWQWFLTDPPRLLAAVKAIQGS